MATGADSFQFFLDKLIKDLSFINDTLALVGLFYLGKLSLKLATSSLYALKTYLVPFVFSNEKWLKSLGNWAVVTGCTHGIGLAYANELAKRRLNLILISRNPELLKKLADFFGNASAILLLKECHLILMFGKLIEEKYGIDTLIVAVDVNEPNSLEIMKKAIMEKDIAVLVNNVAYALEYTEFHMNPPPDLDRMINVNIRTITHLTNVVLSKMIEKNKGAIVNLSSGITYLSAERNVLYGSTKHFINGLTLSLQHEYKHTNITFQCLNPFLVKTPGSVKALGKSNYQCTASEYASSAIRILGYSNHTSGHWAHGLTYLFVSMVPKSVMNWIATSFQNKHRAPVHTQPVAYDDFDTILNGN